MNQQNEEPTEIRMELSTPEAREILAKAMVEPLNEILNRKLFSKEETVILVRKK